MTETTPTAVKPRTPGIVIFVAVLNFLSAGLFFLFSFLCLMFLVFGNILGLYDVVSKHIVQYYQPPNLSLGMNFVVISLLVICAMFMSFFFILGISLLKGRRMAWYFQIALSILGLLGIPFGTILNIVILIFFFQTPVRDYFEV